MIQLTAKIIMFTDNGEITSVKSNINGNNISCDIAEIANKQNSVGGNPFLLGVSKIGDGSTFTTNKVDYFIGKEGANEYGIFENPYEIEFIDSGINSVSIVFDTFNKRYPTELTIDGVLYYNDDAVFTIPLGASNNRNHKIKISTWNTPNYPLVIQSIGSPSNSFEINRRNLISISSNIIDRSDIKLPSWGLISNGGSIEFNDYNGEILDYAEKGLLHEGCEVYIYLEDTLTKRRQTIGNFITSSWNYDNENRSVSVSLTDGLESLQDIILTKPLDYNETSLNSILDFILLQIFPTKPYNTIIDDETKSVLNETKGEFLRLEQGNVWSQLRKMCEVAGLYIYAHPQNRRHLVISHEFRGL